MSILYFCEFPKDLGLKAFSKADFFNKLKLHKLRRRLRKFFEKALSC